MSPRARGVEVLVKKLIEIAGIKVIFTQKKMRSISIRISLPEVEVRVSASPRYSLVQVEEFVLSKIEWIKKSRARLLKLIDEGKIKLPPKLVSGEEHYFFGEKIRLEVIKNSAANHLVRKAEVLELCVKGQSNFKQRQKILDDFYRQNLREAIPNLIKKYEEKMGVKVAEFGIKKMKTRWGTCNVRDHRIWLNLELAKKSPKFLESIVVHEMTHLLEANHSKKFYQLMDRFMPDWSIWRNF